MDNKALFDLIRITVAIELLAREDDEPFEDSSEWVGRELVSVHCGDCTGLPCTCGPCYADELLERADNFLKKEYRIND